MMRAAAVVLAGWLAAAACPAMPGGAAAVADLDQAIRANPDDAAAYADRAAAKLARGDANGALADCA